MAKRHRRHIPGGEEVEMDLMPMIDIIFQLLIFFLLSAKFIAFEGQLQAYLPKDRGPNTAPATLELTSIDLFLSWNNDTKEVTCITKGYIDPDTRERADFHTFAPDPGIGTGPGGEPVTVTRMEKREKGGEVTFDFHAPDFQRVEDYMAIRKVQHEQTGSGKGLPVNVTFEDGVPWQAVVNILDICDRLGITDFSITAKEIEY